MTSTRAKISLPCLPSAGWTLRTLHSETYINILHSSVEFTLDKETAPPQTIGDIFQATGSKPTDFLPLISSYSFKMQFIAAAAAFAFAIFSVPGEAAPSPGPVWSSTATIQLANDHSGANADVAIPVDGVTRSIEELWGHTSIARNGLVFASSAQLVAFSQTVVCTITDDHPHVRATLDAEKTWVSLGGGRVVDLCSAHVVCRCEDM